MVGETHDENAVRGCESDAHEGAHQGRHAEVRLCQEQHPHDAAEGERHRHQYNEGVDPALEINDQEQVNEDDRQGNAREQAGVAFAHGLDLTAEGHMDGLLGGGLVGRDHFVDVQRSRVQVAALHVGVHVKHRSDVELRGHQGDLLAAEARQVHEQLAPAGWAGCGDGHRLDVLGRIEAVSGLLDDQGVAHAVARIDPEVGRGLSARIRGDEYVVGGLPLRNANLSCEGAIDIHAQRRCIRHLEDV